MSKKWDEMTPEQQREIGEAAVKDYNETPSGTSLADSLTMKAVRASECPTWSAEGFEARCSDGRRMAFSFYYPPNVDGFGCEVVPSIAAALNAHEREKRGIK